MSDHCDEELFALLSGDLGRDETVRVVAHLRECGACTSELISVAVAHGSLRAARRAESVLVPRRDDVAVGSPASGPAEQPPLRLPAGRRHRVLTAAAASILVLGAAAGAGFALVGRTAAPVSATAALHRLDAPRSATGKATVLSAGATRQMDVVTTGLPPAPANHYYEVWLLEPTTNKMLPVGVLSPTGTSTYAVASTIMAQFSAVDISLQANDGTTAHSTVSVLRGAVRKA